MSSHFRSIQKPPILILELLLLFGVQPFISGQTTPPSPSVDPSNPSKEYIRINGQPIAVLSGGGSGAQVPTTTSLLKGNGQGGITAAIPGTDYQTPISNAAYLANLTSDVQSQINALASKPAYNPAFPNTSSNTVSNIVVIGDSHLKGYGQTASIPSQIIPAESFSITNLAVNASKFCAYWADRGSHEAQADALYNPLARANILVVEGGLNDSIDNSTGFPAVPWITPQEVYDCKVSYAKRRKAVGWTIVAYPAYSRSQVGINQLTGDQLHNQLNDLEAAGWQAWADAYMPATDPPGVFANGENSGSCFQSDHIHVADACTAALANKLAATINLAASGLGKSGGSSTFNGGTLTNKLQVSINTVGIAIEVKNALANDFAWETFGNDSGKIFGLGTGGSTSTQPNKFFIYNWANGSFPLTIDQSDIVHVAHLDVAQCTGCSSGSAFNGGTVTNKVEVSINTADMGISVKNALASDYAWQSFTNDSGKLFGVGVGGSNSPQPNSFFIYNGTNNSFPLTIDTNGLLKLAALAAPAGQKYFLCIDGGGSVTSQASACQ